MVTRSMISLVLLGCVLLPTLAQAGDATAVSLQRCLGAPDNASTGGQTQCEAMAQHDYDRRLNVAYARLMRTLAGDARQRLQQAQRAWLAFRGADTAARDALYATRQGTMYVPMQAASTTAIIRERALQLEGDVHVLAIEP